MHRPLLQIVVMVVIIAVIMFIIKIISNILISTINKIVTVGRSQRSHPWSHHEAIDSHRTEHAMTTTTLGVHTLGVSRIVTRSGSKQPMSKHVEAYSVCTVCTVFGGFVCDFFSFFVQFVDGFFFEIACSRQILLTVPSTGIRCIFS